MFIPLNTAAYSPNTLNSGSPRQANQTTGKGFFTAPNRKVSGNLVRSVSSTFADVWSQPRLFFNSLLPAEQQMVVNAIRFETSHLKSSIVKNNVLIQLNRVSHELSERVATALGMKAPAADPTYYHNNSTIGVSVGKDPVRKLDGLKVGFLTSTQVSSTSDMSSLKSALSAQKVSLVVVAESLSESVDQTYSAADATGFDALIIGDGTASMFAAPSSLANANSTSSPRVGGNSTAGQMSTLFPAGRPMQILLDSYRWGKPIAAIGSGKEAFRAAGIKEGEPGVYASGSSSGLSEKLEAGMKQFKFYDRFPMDH